MGYEIRKRITWVPIDMYSVFVGIKSSSEKKILTVQVGANDGKTNDPIFAGAKEFSDKLILIEPQVQLHERLRENYSDFKGQIEIHGVVISPNNKEQDLYTIKEKFHNHYFKKAGSNPSGIASLDRQHLIKMLKKHGFNGHTSNQMIERRSVKCTTLKKILSSYNNDYFIVLQVDCEGADWLVLKTLESIIPNVINFEKKHLSKDHYDEIFNWLNETGYQHIDYGGDCLAIRVRS